MITIQSLLQSAELSELTVMVGDGGLDNTVKTVTVLDAPDGPKWLKGKELILTSAYIFGDDEEKLFNFVQDLINVGASGLCIKMGRFVGEIPKKVCEIADLNTFPILKIPYRFVWTDIIAPFYELKYGLKSEKSIIKVEPNMIMPIFDASRRGSERLMGKLTEYLKIPIIIINSAKDVIYDNGLKGVELIYEVIKDPDLQPEKAKQELLRTKDSFFTINAIPITSLDQREYLVTTSPIEGNIWEICKLFNFLEILTEENLTTYMDKDQLYKKLLLKVVTDRITSEEIKKFEDLCGYKDSAYSAILLITAENYLDVYEQIKEVIRHIGRKVNSEINTYMLYDTAGKEAVVLLNHSGIEENINLQIWLRGLLSELDDELLEKGKGCIAVSNIYPTLQNIAVCYREACDARDIGRLLWRDQNKFLYSSLAFYVLLRDMNYSEFDFEDINLLHQSQNKMSFDGIATIEIYIESGNYKKAASKLYIHENTLRYRVKKVIEQLNLDLENPIARHSILTKIKMWRLKNSENL